MRPTIWRLARDLNITGHVRNDGEGVFIEAWGTPTEINQFIEALLQQAPVLSNIYSIEHSPLSGTAASTFTILESKKNTINTHLPADAATCPECLKEIFNPKDRRYRYPFTNCTHCGPRFSIIEQIPYDRTHTSMRHFTQCSDCQNEYETPADRRYHAQANNCPTCGPKLWLEDGKGNPFTVTQKDSLSTCAELLRAGKIIAIKGIGGFHLACDASQAQAVSRLRQRKNRQQKPFALMASNINMIHRYAHCGEAEQQLLLHSAAPIVLLQRLSHATPLANNIAPNQHCLGFMLPYTPPHHLLMSELDSPLVMTSANISDSPQCVDNEQAKDELSNIADYFLLHDREIINRCDDSVTRIALESKQTIRRARGYVPQPLHLAHHLHASKNILALGAELKSTFCLLRNQDAFISQHLGDLKNADSWRDFKHNLRLYQTLFDFKAEIIAIDQHPNYLTSQLGRTLAEEHTIPLVEVQHHHAHIAACMAEHGIPSEQTVIGIALDGLGAGEQNQIWGAEFLKVTYLHSYKLAGFEPIAMPGGNRATLEPWRNTLANLITLPVWNSDQLKQLELIKFLHSKPLDTLIQAIERNLNSPKASSAGRLFDAVAAAIGICRNNIHYEGQAAMELEALASSCFADERSNAYEYELKNGQLHFQPLWAQLLEDLKKRTPNKAIAARFHHGVINAVVETASQLAEQNDLDTIALSGGVFQNQLLQREVKDRLEQNKYKILIPKALPLNDGGISLGQAIIACHKKAHPTTC